jgi:DNA-binding NarL/FixJ family response regulator
MSKVVTSFAASAAFADQFHADNRFGRELFRLDGDGDLPARCEDRTPEPALGAAQRRLVLIDSRLFFREIIQKSIETALAIPVQAFSSISELADQNIPSHLVRLLMIFLAEGESEESAQALDILSRFARSVPTVILSSNHDFAMMRAVMVHGAKAYIPMTMGFDIAIEAVRFVLAGGTYVPADCLLAATPIAAATSQRPTGGAITTRELAVVKAIQQGKPNKIIAYELNMCESTVKVHVRRIMKKMRARNRTDVAIKATELLSCSGCPNQSGCWSAARCLRKSV